MTMIPRTTIIRRPGAKRWHIRDTQHNDGTTMCGQRLGNRTVSSTTRAETITCDDCLVAAISQGRTS